MKAELSGNCRTTAMGILPHRSPEAALNLALSLDIPFWPQLPKLSFYEDMYVQASEHLPGIVIDEEGKRITFSLERFYEELPAYFENLEDPHYLRLSSRYSLVYDAFLARDLSGFYAVRGQCIGPVSYGLKITDEKNKPVIYHDEVRQFLFDFFSRKVKVQYEEMVRHHPRAFVWVGSPGWSSFLWPLQATAQSGRGRTTPLSWSSFPDPGGYTSAATLTGPSCSIWT